MKAAWRQSTASHTAYTLTPLQFLPQAVLSTAIPELPVNLTAFTNLHHPCQLLSLVNPVTYTGSRNQNWTCSVSPTVCMHLLLFSLMRKPRAHCFNWIQQVVWWHFIRERKQVYITPTFTVILSLGPQTHQNHLLGQGLPVPCTAHSEPKCLNWETTFFSILIATNPLPDLMTACIPFEHDQFKFKDFQTTPGNPNLFV